MNPNLGWLWKSLGMVFAARPMACAAVAWLLVIGAVTPAGVRLTAHTNKATVPFTAPGGYTVDVPADWRLSNPAGNLRMATAATGPFQGQLFLEGGDSVALQVAEAKKRTEFQSVPHPGGTMYFTKKVAPPLPTAYQIFVDLGGRAVHVRCSEAPGNETGPAGCLTIARSLRFTASSGNAAPAPSTPQAPVQTVATPATTVPTADARGDDRTVPLTVSDTGFTVDVPASWERREGGRGAAASSPDRTGRLTIEGGVSLARAMLREAERTNRLQAVPTAQGRVLYSSRGEGPTQVGYQIFVELGDQAARFECWERKGDTGPGGCFAIARSGRFAPSTAPAVPQYAATAPLTSRDGFTVDVPAEWAQGESGAGTLIARARLGGGVSIGPTEQKNDESIRYVLARAEKDKQRYRCLPLRDGRVCFDAQLVSGGTFYVSIGQRLRTFQCSQEGLEWTGPAACESIAQTARFEAIPQAAAAGSAQPVSSVAPSAATPPAVPPIAPVPTSSVPFNSYRGMLFTVRDIPSVMSDGAALLDATRAQVLAEQAAWKQIEGMLKAAAAPPMTSSQAASRPKWNPKKPAFTYEWQTAVDSNPGLAAQLMQLFLRSDANWSIVTGDPAWDDRLAALADVFMFTRDRVVGREAGFAAQELTSVYRRHLEAAAAQAPTELWIAKSLPAAGYDFDAKALRFLVPGVAPFGGRHTFTDQADILDSAEQPNSYYTIPASAKGRANYQLFGVASSMQKADPPMSKPGLRTARSPLDVWRTFYQIGSSWDGAPMVELLTLDRRIELASIPIDARKAEALAQATNYQGTIGGLTAKLFFRADHVELGERVIDRKSTKVAVLFASVQKIDVHDATGELIAAISADALRQGAPSTAVQADPPQAPPKPANPVPGQAERERERQQKMKTTMNDRTAEIRARNEVALAVQREAQARVNACIQQAAKANPSQTSPAYQRALDACTQKVRRMSTCVQQADKAGLNPLSPEYKQSVDSCVQDVWK